MAICDKKHFITIRVPIVAHTSYIIPMIHTHASHQLSLVNFKYLADWLSTE